MALGVILGTLRSPTTPLAFSRRSCSIVQGQREKAPRLAEAEHYKSMTRNYDLPTVKLPLLGYICSSAKGYRKGFRKNEFLI